jgi:RNA polymerase sigma-70 factor, ECF subfamily
VSSRDDTTLPIPANTPTVGEDPTRPEDAELRRLMTRYQDGDLDAFDELYRRLLPRIRAAVGRLGLPPAVLDDVVQESFLQLHRARHTYDPSYPVPPWAAAIARHVALMYHRAASRRPHATQSIEEAAVPVPAEAERFADRAAVREALASLPPGRRRPVVWHHVFGLSFREIARRLGIGEDAAKLRSSRGMAALRTRLSMTASESDRDDA